MSDRIRDWAAPIRQKSIHLIPRICEPPGEPDYPFHDRTVRVTRCGRICIGKRKIDLSQVFTGQMLALREVKDGIWLVSFMHYDLG